MEILYQMLGQVFSDHWKCQLDTWKWQLEHNTDHRSYQTPRVVRFFSCVSIQATLLAQQIPAWTDHTFQTFFFLPPPSAFSWLWSKRRVALLLKCIYPKNIFLCFWVSLGQAHAYKLYSVLKNASHCINTTSYIPRSGNSFALIKRWHHCKYLKKLNYIVRCWENIN